MEKKMEINGKDVYMVAVKALMRDGIKLLLTHDIFDGGKWDLPGGRIKKFEFGKPLEEVLERKLREELGDKVQYEIGEPKTFFQVQRNETLEEGGEMEVRIFGVGYEVEYLGGEIKLGEHHDKLEWVSVDDLKPEEYLKGGWEVGVANYIEKVRNS
ncbi:NUDIX hydrolase [Alphaproteobacteria bacterium]|nr:NUDIX hydrolase [Alphaproteobacteria bacterium]